MKQRSWLTPARFVVIALLGVVIMPISWLYVTPGLTAEQACRNTAALTEGYAPWEQKSLTPALDGSGKMHVSFHDGFNSLSCNAVQFGGIWYVLGSVQTMVGCGRWLDDGSGSGRCPRGRFGVK